MGNDFILVTMCSMLSAPAVLIQDSLLRRCPIRTHEQDADKLEKKGSWRRDRDSNPGDSFLSTRVPGVRLRPLGHLSMVTLENTLEI